EEPGGKRDVEADAGPRLVRRCQPQVRAGRQREQQRGDLGEPQFSDQPLRRGDRDRGGTKRLNRKSRAEGHSGDEDRSEALGHLREMVDGRWEMVKSLDRAAWPLANDMDFTRSLFVGR